MKLEYDKEADAAYLYFKYPIKDGESKKTIQLNENIILDFDAANHLLGVEILDASKVLQKQALAEIKAISSAAA